MIGHCTHYNHLSRITNDQNVIFSSKNGYIFCIKMVFVFIFLALYFPRPSLQIVKIIHFNKISKSLSFIFHYFYKRGNFTIHNLTLHNIKYPPTTKIKQMWLYSVLFV